MQKQIVSRNGLTICCMAMAWEYLLSRKLLRGIPDRIVRHNQLLSLPTIGDRAAIMPGDGVKVPSPVKLADNGMIVVGHADGMRRAECDVAQALMIIHRKTEFVQLCGLG